MARPLAEWLALREPFDRASRSAVLVQAVAAAMPTARPTRIVDLGTGRGSNVRYLTARLPLPQDWLLVDRDPTVLAELPRAMAGALDDRCRFEARLANLGVLDSAVVAGRDLVTASALLDLVSVGWLGALADCCRGAGAVVLFALTYNGQSRCSPQEPEDDDVRALLNRHQRSNDRGFGRAAGPEAVAAAARAFSAAGYRVRRAPSDWHLPPDAHELQRQLVDGWAEAAIEIAPDQAETIGRWRRRRHAHIDEGSSRIIVGHEDFVALPATESTERTETESTE